MAKFDDVPTEDETRILISKNAKWGDFDTLYQIWTWAGVQAESLIFLTKDISMIPESELLEDIRSSAMVKDKDTEITCKTTSKFTFFNFNFIVDD